MVMHNNTSFLTPQSLSPETIEESGDPSKQRDLTPFWVVLIVVAFVVVRLPTLLFSPGGQDEEWYGVPGLTIAQEGIPRVPYSRATDKDSVFLGAEEMLFAQPPLSFYAQAPFFRYLPGTYGTARLASLVAACLSILLVYSIGIALFQNTHLALTGAFLFSISRLCFFPALVARPDMICGMLGLFAMFCMAKWYRTEREGWLMLAGTGVGLAGLTHPFAIVFGVQFVFWSALARGTFFDRARRLARFLLPMSFAFSLWLLLIRERPDLFDSQFIGNILRPTGPGLLSRFIMPFESFANQIPQLLDRAHPIQFGMLTLGLVLSGIIAWRARQTGPLICWGVTVSSVYLLVVFLGIHPIQGFWCYSAALAWLCFVYTVMVWMRSMRTSRFVSAFLWGLILLVMLPGAGMRTVVAYVQHWGDPVYSNPRFIRSILDDLPAEATLTVGPEFALDAYACGRDVILACRHPMYFDSAQYPTDYYIFGRRDFAEGMPEAYRCKLVKSYGNRDDIFAGYAEVYRRSE